MTELKIKPKNTGLILAGTMLSLLLAALDNTIVGTAMPKVIRDLNGLNHYSWPFTAYLLFSTAVIPIAGKLADVYGRKIVDLSGIIIFMASSALCGLSADMTQLILFRALQGIGGGIIISSAFIIVGEIFPPNERGKYIGMVASMFGLASLIGPVTGGIITDALSWRWIFYINLPLGFAAFGILYKALPLLKHPDGGKKVDLGGVTAFLLAVFPLLLAFSEGGRSIPWESPLLLGLLTLSLVMLVLFFRIERRSSDPLLPVGLFSNKVFSMSAIAAFLAYAGMFGSILFIPLLAQAVIGKSAAASGMLLIPMTLSMMLGANLGGMLAVKTARYRLIGMAGFALAVTGMALLAGMGSHTVSAVVMTGAAFLGLGIGLTMPVYNIAPQSVFPPRQLGIVTASLQFFQDMGGVIASSILGSVMLSSMDKNLSKIDSTILPSALQQSLRNPKIITNPAALEKIKSQLPADLTDSFQSFVNQAREAIGSSILLVFLICVFVLLTGIAVMAFLDERAVKEGMAKYRKPDFTGSPGTEVNPALSGNESEA